MANDLRQPQMNALKHGECLNGSVTDEYRAWLQMRQRCSNPGATGYQRYGGRGIRVCDRWQTSFAAFLEDVGRRPSAKHSIDRIDNDGDYEPGNVRWSTHSEQCSNQSVRRDNCSGLKGVTYDIQRDRWTAHFRGKYLGIFRTRIEAHRRRLDVTRAFT